jgi:uncharacterized protein (TIGR03435 family)
MVTEKVFMRLDFGKKVMMMAVGLMAIVVPMSSGQVNSTRGSASLQGNGEGSSKLPDFDVVSVKLNESGAMMFSERFMPDGIRASNAPVIMLIREAYGLRNSNNDQIQGVPGWAKSDRYDIEAKVNGANVAEFAKLSREQHDLMLQTLLADRFKLIMHRETRELPVYALIIAKNGPKLKEAKAGDTYPKGIKGLDGYSGPGAVIMEKGEIEAQDIPMTELVSMLTQETGRTVLDKTGLAGKYDISLKWTPDEESAQMPNATESQQGNPSDVSGTSIFTALQEQLGLKLESQKGPVEGLVMDHLEKPSPN